MFTYLLADHIVPNMSARQTRTLNPTPWRTSGHGQWLSVYHNPTVAVENVNTVAAQWSVHVQISQLQTTHFVAMNMCICNCQTKTRIGCDSCQTKTRIGSDSCQTKTRIGSDSCKQGFVISYCLGVLAERCLSNTILNTSWLNHMSCLLSNSFIRLRLICDRDRLGYTCVGPKPFAISTDRSPK